MPRKSFAASLIPPVDGSPPAIKPPTSLSPPEAQLFTELVAATARGHFRPTDIPLLARYCEAAVLAEEAARQLRVGGAVVDGKPSGWLYVQEKCVRALTGLSLRLRLSPQARLTNRTVSRQKLPDGRPRPWEDKEEA
jgi:phage terminase small subunit